MNALQNIVFQLLIQKLAEQQTDVAEMREISKGWRFLNKSDKPLPAEVGRFDIAFKRYSLVTNEINGLTRALNESI